MWDAGKGFIRPFFPQLGCLRLQEELLNIDAENLLRMQDLIKSPIKKLTVQSDA